MTSTVDEVPPGARREERAASEAAAPPAPERRERPPRLSLLVAGPVLWAAHFLASYGTASVYCAKAGASIAAANEHLTLVATLILAYTVAALAGIALVARVGFARLREDVDGADDAASTPNTADTSQTETEAGASVGELLGPGEPYDGDTDVERTRFLGFAALLLCGLSAIAVVFAALVVFFVGDCR